MYIHIHERVHTVISANIRIWAQHRRPLRQMNVSRRQSTQDPLDRVAAAIAEGG